MILDAVLSDRRCWWLSPECDKRTFFDRTQPTGLSPDEYPHIRCFPDKLPIGIEKQDTSRFVFVYIVNRRDRPDFRQFLLRHAELFRCLHHWTVRLLLPRRLRRAAALSKSAVREQLWTPLNPSVSKSLEAHFRERQHQGGHLRDSSDRYIAQEFRKQGRRSKPSIALGDDPETGLHRARRLEGPHLDHEGGRLRYVPLTARLKDALQGYRHLKGPLVLTQSERVPADGRHDRQPGAASGRACDAAE
jgi:hypothetical protein